MVLVLRVSSGARYDILDDVLAFIEPVVVADFFDILVITSILVRESDLHPAQVRHLASDNVSVPLRHATFADLAYRQLAERDQLRLPVVAAATVFIVCILWHRGASWGFLHLGR